MGSAFRARWLRGASLIASLREKNRIPPRPPPTSRVLWPGGPIAARARGRKDGRRLFRRRARPRAGERGNSQLLGLGLSPLASPARGHSREGFQSLGQEKVVHAAIEHGWSRNVLAHPIDTRLHLRQGQAVSNFDRTLPPEQSALAQLLLKDPYSLDFLGLGAEALPGEWRESLPSIQALEAELDKGLEGRADPAP